MNLYILNFGSKPLMGTSVLAATRELEPLEYINSINKPVHSAMFYNDEIKSRQIEYTFILNGLKKEERCIYLTDENTNQIAAKMKTYGINLEKFFDKKLLHIYQLQKLGGSTNYILNNARKIIEEMMDDIKPPRRSVGRVVRDITTKSGIAAMVKVEEGFHESFSSFNGAFLCSYPYKQIESSQKERWMTDIIYNHDSSLFIPTHGTGKALVLTH